MDSSNVPEHYYQHNKQSVHDLTEDFFSLEICDLGAVVSEELLKGNGGGSESLIRIPVSTQDENMNGRHIASISERDQKEAMDLSNQEVNQTDDQTNDINTTLINSPTIDAPVKLSSMCHSADNIGVKWIVLLEEICLSRGWPIPTYETEIDSSEGVYAALCRIHEYCEVGKAKKEEVARDSAARMMCSRLKAIPQEGKNSFDSSQCDLDSTNLQLEAADDNRKTCNSIEESGISGKVKAIGCSDIKTSSSLPEACFSGEAKEMGCSDNDTSSSIPEPCVSNETKATGCGENNTSSRILEPCVSGETKAMDSGDNVKHIGNSIGSLQEMCMAQRWPLPTYKIEADVGPPHARVFTIACSVLNCRELGVGSTVKRAKQEAANKMLICLQENPLESSQISNSSLFAPLDKLGTINFQNVSGGNNSNSSVRNADYATPGKTNAKDSTNGNDNNVGNPVGYLQEICVSRGLPLPIYKIESEVGPPHVRIFTIACCVLNYRELGVGSNTKAAKRLAADKMLTRLQENNN